MGKKHDYFIKKGLQMDKIHEKMSISVISEKIQIKG